MKYKLTALLLTMLVFGCSQPKTEQTADSTIKKNVERAKELMILGDNHGAYNVLYELYESEDAAKEDFAINYYIYLSLKRDNADRALHYLRKAYDLNKEYAYNYDTYGDIFRSMLKEPSGVTVEVLDRMLATLPSRFTEQIFYMKANTYRDNKMFDSAVVYYRRIVENESEASSQNIVKDAQEAVSFIEYCSDYDRKPLGMFADAVRNEFPEDVISDLEELLRQYPDAKIAGYARFFIAIQYDHEKLNLFDSALVNYERVYTNPDYMPSIRELGRVNFNKILVNMNAMGDQRSGGYSIIKK